MSIHLARHHEREHAAAAEEAHQNNAGNEEGRRGVPPVLVQRVELVCHVCAHQGLNVRLQSARPIAARP
eukprot:7387390-Prymnesium_polylepis.1